MPKVFLSAPTFLHTWNKQRWRFLGARELEVAYHPQLWHIQAPSIGMLANYVYAEERQASRKRQLHIEAAQWSALAGAPSCQRSRIFIQGYGGAQQGRTPSESMCAKVALAASELTLHTWRAPRNSHLRPEGRALVREHWAGRPRRTQDRGVRTSVQWVSEVFEQNKCLHPVDKSTRVALFRTTNPNRWKKILRWRVSENQTSSSAFIALVETSSWKEKTVSAAPLLQITSRLFVHPW